MCIVVSVLCVMLVEVCVMLCVWCIIMCYVVLCYVLRIVASYPGPFTCVVRAGER